MILAPVTSVHGFKPDAPMTFRLIGVLDRVLVESFTDACAGMLVTGPRTLIVSLRETLATRDESLTRFVAMLAAYQIAGHNVMLDINRGWARLLGDSALMFARASDADFRDARRGFILAHSTDRRAGAV